MDQGRVDGGLKVKEWLWLHRSSFAPPHLPPQFIEQENQVCRGHMREVEEELKTSRSALWERNAQLEDLKDAHQILR